MTKFPSLTILSVMNLSYRQAMIRWVGSTTADRCALTPASRYQLKDIAVSWRVSHQQGDIGSLELVK